MGGDYTITEDICQGLGDRAGAWSGGREGGRTHGVGLWNSCSGNNTHSWFTGQFGDLSQAVLGNGFGQFPPGALVFTLHKERLEHRTSRSFLPALQLEGSVCSLQEAPKKWPILFFPLQAVSCPHLPQPAPSFCSGSAPDAFSCT